MPVIAMIGVSDVGTLILVFGFVPAENSRPIGV